MGVNINKRHIILSDASGTKMNAKIIMIKSANFKCVQKAVMDLLMDVIIIINYAN